MKRSLLLLLFSNTLLIFPTVAHGQAWSGIIAPARAIDWTGAGVVGGIPSGSWTQCGSTIAAYNGSAATINTALAGCAANHFVLLGPGTFNLTSQISFPTTGHVVLRGSGANSTFLVAPSSGIANCQLGSAMICMQSSDQTYGGPSATYYGWTSGYAQGSNQITLSSTVGINTTNPTMLMLEQCETGFSAASPTAACTGTSTDNGQLFVCSDLYNASGPTGCDNNGPGNENPRRGHFEMTTATAINGNVVTIADPLKYPDWNAGNAPRVWFAKPIVMVGVENLAIDDIANGATDLIQTFNAYNWWVSGCKFSNWGRWASENFLAQHGTIQNNYFYHSTGPDSYGIRLQNGGNNVFQNNIIEQVFAPIILDGASSGDVIAYNFIINQNYQSDFMRGAGAPHDVNAFELYEGNVFNQMGSDGAHGTNTFNTRFRNFATGWDSCANGQCGTTTAKGSDTSAMQDMYADRYQNVIGNVLGTPGWHTIYTASAGCFQSATIYLPGCSNIFPTDPLVQTTSMYWGNYDTVNAAVRFVNAEVPTGASTYPNSVPASQSLPPSFYLSAKPSWFGSIPWPAIGPDVTGGNVGQCSGTLNTAGHQSGMPATSSSQCTGTSLTTPAWGGHINANPAMNCYLNVMRGVPDGTGGVRPFNANTCYGGSSSQAGLNPPTNLVVVVN